MMREFVAAEPGARHRRSPRRRPQAAGHGFQQFIADQVPERVVDALEFVDVDVEHRQLLAARERSAARGRAVRGTAPGSADRSARRNAPCARSARRTLALGDVLHAWQPSRRLRSPCRRPGSNAHPTWSTTIGVWCPAAMLREEGRARYSSTPVAERAASACDVRSPPRSLQPGLTIRGDMPIISVNYVGCRSRRVPRRRRGSGPAPYCSRRHRAVASPEPPAPAPAGSFALSSSMSRRWSSSDEAGMVEDRHQAAEFATGIRRRDTRQ